MNISTKFLEGNNRSQLQCKRKWTERREEKKKKNNPLAPTEWIKTKNKKSQVKWIVND